MLFEHRDPLGLGRVRGQCRSNGQALDGGACLLWCDIKLGERGGETALDTLGTGLTFDLASLPHTRVFVDDALQLKSEGVDEVATAENLQDALNAARNSQFDLALLDYNMPGMSGFDFLEAALDRLGEGFATMVVVMLTTSLAEDDKERARSFAVVKDYLSKPLTEEELRKIAITLHNDSFEEYAKNVA